MTLKSARIGWFSEKSSFNSEKKIIGLNASQYFWENRVATNNFSCHCCSYRTHSFKIYIKWWALGQETTRCYCAGLGSNLTTVQRPEDYLIRRAILHKEIVLFRGIIRLTEASLKLKLHLIFLLKFEPGLLGGGRREHRQPVLQLRRWQQVLLFRRRTEGKKSHLFLQIRFCLTELRKSLFGKCWQHTSEDRLSSRWCKEWNEMSI